MPKISANKLGEFLVTANPIRRLRILSAQKYPSNAVVPLYRMAQAPLAAYLQSNGQHAEPLLAAIDRMRSDVSGSRWAVTDRQNTADALERILQLAGRLPLEQPTYEYRKVPAKAIKLFFSGVDVSVRPDFLLHVSRRGKQYCGAVKFHYAKTPERALKEQGAQYVASLLYRWLQESAASEHEPRPDLCLSIDVFRGAIIPAPRAVTTRLSEIETACQEIAIRWDHL
ncbi:hypothetical protein E4695_05800 [Alcaligenaceae bacterium 429]|nr:hypothetical protein E4695_05800 [Alcaligenaceae bacterium 429]